MCVCVRVCVWGVVCVCERACVWGVMCRGTIALTVGTKHCRMHTCTGMCHTG